MLRRLAIGVVLALLVALPVGAQDFKKGVAAEKRGDYALAVKWYRKAAAQGVVEAQHNLGVMYDRGQGVPQDYPACPASV